MGHANRYFYNANDTDDETLHHRITPTDEQQVSQQERWKHLRDFLIDDLRKRSGYPTRSWLQGSYKFGTQVRPVRRNEQYDIDLGMYVVWEGEPEDGNFSPCELKNMIQAGLEEYCRLNPEATKVDPPKSRCSRIHFHGNFHIDVPVYHLDETRDKRSLATDDDTWESKDPKAFYVWFRDLFDDNTRAQARRLIRYFKAWAALKFKDLEQRPSSVLLTVLVSEALSVTRMPKLYVDDDLLARIISTVLARVEQTASVPNPVEDDEDLVERYETENWNKFARQLRQFNEAAQSAQQCESSTTACLAWSAAFAHLIPLPENEPINQQTLPALVQQPIVFVQATKNGYAPKTGTNAIDHVPLRYDISFTVQNADDFPPGTEFAWMVRNHGPSAEAALDLGHTYGTGRSATESSAYGGRHFMDCIALRNNIPIGMRRIPVRITGLPPVRRNPPRQAAYRKLA